ncbi:hypothetical protein IBX65_06050, partial [Candidatus Aerophobetes bacterium]|nr:hypothetical protein [Candidatus Aerophobetes bacterium]
MSYSNFESACQDFSSNNNQTIQNPKSSKILAQQSSNKSSDGFLHTLKKGKNMLFSEIKGANNMPEKTRQAARRKLGMKWTSRRGIMGKAFFVVLISVTLLWGISGLAHAVSVTSNPDGVVATPNIDEGGLRLESTDLTIGKYYRLTVIYPIDAFGNTQITRYEWGPATTTSFNVRYYGNAPGWSVNVPSLEWPGRYDVVLGEYPDGTYTSAETSEKTYFYVVDEISVTPTPDGIPNGSDSVIAVDVETVGFFPPAGLCIPQVGDEFTINIRAADDASGTTELSGEATLVFDTTSHAGTAVLWGSPASLSLDGGEPADRYTIRGEQTFYPNVPTIPAPIYWDDTFPGLIFGHPYFYIFEGVDVATIEVHHPNALLQGESESTATTFDIALSYSGATSADFAASETVTILVAESGPRAFRQIYGWTSGDTVTLVAESATRFSVTDARLAQKNTAPRDTYTLHAYENAHEIFDPSAHPQFADDTTAIHPYLFILDSLDVVVDAPDVFNSALSNQTTFDVIAAGTFDDPTNGQAPYTATVAISFDSASVYISPATTTLTLTLSGGVLASYDTALFYNADLGPPDPSRVTFVIWENWAGNPTVPADENPNETDPWFNGDFPGDQFELTGSPYVYAIDGPFHFNVHPPDAFLAGSANQTTFDAWVDGSITGASTGDTITVLVNASGASAMVSAATAVTLVYDGEQFATYDVPLYIGAISAGRYLLHAQKNEVDGPYWDTLDTNVGDNHPYVYVLDMGNATYSHGSIRIKECHPDVFVAGTSDATVLPAYGIHLWASVEGGGNSNRGAGDRITLDIRNAEGTIQARNVVLGAHGQAGGFPNLIAVYFSNHGVSGDGDVDLLVDETATANTRHTLGFYKSGSVDSFEPLEWGPRWPWTDESHHYVYVFDDTTNIFEIFVYPPDVFVQGSADTTTFDIQVPIGASSDGDTINVRVFCEADTEVSAGTVTLVASGGMFAATEVTVDVSASALVGEKQLDVFEKGDALTYGRLPNKFALNIADSPTSHPYLFVVDKFDMNLTPNAFQYCSSPDTVTIAISADLTTAVSPGNPGRFGYVVTELWGSTFALSTTTVVVVDGDHLLATAQSVDIDTCTLPTGKYDVIVREFASQSFPLSGHTYFYIIGDPLTDDTRFGLTVTGCEVFNTASPDTTTVAVTSQSTNPPSGAVHGDEITILIAASGDITGVSGTSTLYWDGNKFVQTADATVYINSATPGKRWLYAYENGSNFSQFTTDPADWIYLIDTFYIDVFAPDAFLQGSPDYTTFDIWTSPVPGDTGDTLAMIVINEEGDVFADTIDHKVTLTHDGTQFTVTIVISLKYDGDGPHGEKLLQVIRPCDDTALRLDETLAYHPYVYVFSEHFTLDVGNPDAFVRGATDTTTVAITGDVAFATYPGSAGRTATIYLYSELPSEISAATAEVTLVNDGAGYLTPASPPVVLEYLAADANLPAQRVQLYLRENHTVSPDDFPTYGPADGTPLLGHDYLYILDEASSDYFVITVHHPNAFMQSPPMMMPQETTFDIAHTVGDTLSGDTIHINVYISPKGEMWATIATVETSLELAAPYAGASLATTDVQLIVDPSVAENVGKYELWPTEYPADPYEFFAVAWDEGHPYFFVLSKMTAWVNWNVVTVGGNQILRIWTDDEVFQVVSNDTATVDVALYNPAASPPPTGIYPCTTFTVTLEAWPESLDPHAAKAYKYFEFVVPWTGDSEKDEGKYHMDVLMSGVSWEPYPVSWLNPPDLYPGGAPEQGFNYPFFWAFYDEINIIEPHAGDIIKGEVDIKVIETLKYTDFLRFSVAPSGSSVYYDLDGSVGYTEVSDPISTVSGPTGDVEVNNWQAAWDTTWVPAASEGVWYIRVQAYDFSDPESLLGQDIIAVTVDNTPPSIVITEPASRVSGTLTLTAAASDTTTNITEVFWQYAESNSSTWYPLAKDQFVTSPITSSVQLDTTALSDGDWQVKATAYDEAGWTSSDTVSFQVDNTGPIISDISVVPDPTNTDPTLTFAVEDVLNNLGIAELYIDSYPSTAITSITIGAYSASTITTTINIT